MFKSTLMIVVMASAVLSTTSEAANYPLVNIYCSVGLRISESYASNEKTLAATSVDSNGLIHYDGKFRVSNSYGESVQFDYATLMPIDGEKYQLTLSAENNTWPNHIFVTTKVVDETSKPISSPDGYVAGGDNSDLGFCFAKIE